MSPLLVIVAMWVVTYPVRWLGLRLGGTRLPPFWLAFLRFVPVSVFAALVVPELLGTPEWPRRVVGALVGAALMWRTRNLALGILGGFAAYWVARLAGA
ncbi:AzlD domain-containing protein [Deinococcus sp. KSM4-11]|uniref:AzlD domain-containing protein n=1 Tax=Deinococcus sp. KSM4-11 TaxID=2568654 RepID=UPI0010A58CBB|nr:AzlD domain-containing protein [Deinococcus sp. KSM4-11]THF88648.1 AzlD domain-containing protein [Deinococcus sp. KSM4-11]